MFSLNKMLCTVTKCFVCPQTIVLEELWVNYLLLWRAVVSTTVTSHVQHSSNSSDVFPPVIYLSGGTLIEAPVFRISFVRLSSLRSFNNSSLGCSKMFPSFSSFNQFVLKAKTGSKWYSLKKKRKKSRFLSTLFFL